MHASQKRLRALRIVGIVDVEQLANPGIAFRGVIVERLHETAHSAQIKRKRATLLRRTGQLPLRIHL